MHLWPRHYNLISGLGSEPKLPINIVYHFPYRYSGSIEVIVQKKKITTIYMLEGPRSKSCDSI